jgi:WhiB family redox-sensing transcriptional regulator
MTNNWRLRAACRYSPPDVFHPREKKPSGHLAEARGLCAQCPVQAECLAAALADRDIDGFRAGLTGEERKALLPKRAKEDHTDTILRRHAKHWAPRSIALSLGVDSNAVYKVLKAVREAGAA